LFIFPISFFFSSKKNFLLNLKIRNNFSKNLFVINENFKYLALINKFYKYKKINFYLIKKNNYFSKIIIKLTNAALNLNKFFLLHFLNKPKINFLNNKIKLLYILNSYLPTNFYFNTNKFYFNFIKKYSFFRLTLKNKKKNFFKITNFSIYNNNKFSEKKSFFFLNFFLLINIIIIYLKIK